MQIIQKFVLCFFIYFSLHVSMVILFTFKMLEFFIASSPLKLGGGISFLKFGQRGGHEQIAEKQGGYSQKGGISKLLHQFSLRKACFHCYWNFYLVNIHTHFNQQIYSFLWFTFYKKIIYYEISFSLTLIFKYNFVKILLMTLISLSISLETSNILENKSQVFERSECTITVYNDFYYKEQLKI